MRKVAIARIGPDVCTCMLECGDHEYVHECTCVCITHMYMCMRVWVHVHMFPVWVQYLVHNTSTPPPLRKILYYYSNPLVAIRMLGLQQEDTKPDRNHNWLLFAELSAQ